MDLVNTFLGTAREMRTDLYLVPFFLILPNIHLMLSVKEYQEPSRHNYSKFESIHSPFNR